MNERIRDLALDALVENITSEKWVFTEAELERFAKSIVRECANHCDLLLDYKMSSEWARGTYDCSRAIRKHFGVEE